MLEGVRRSDYSTLRETHIGCFILTLNGTTTTAAPISPVIATPPPPPLRAPRFWFYVPPLRISTISFIPLGKVSLRSIAKKYIVRQLRRP